MSKDKTYVVCRHCYNSKEAMDKQDSTKTWDDWQVFDNRADAITQYAINMEMADDEVGTAKYLRSQAVAVIIKSTDWD